MKQKKGPVGQKLVSQKKPNRENWAEMPEDARARGPLGHTT